MEPLLLAADSELADLALDSDDATRKLLIEVIEAVVATHADAPKGLLCVEDRDTEKAVLDAHALQQVLFCRDVFAMEVIDPSRPKPALYEKAGVSWTRGPGFGLPQLSYPKQARFPLHLG